MSSLSNYLSSNRKRLALSQEEVGFMLGINGEGKGTKVSRDENSAREPSLQAALAYEAIYGKPVRELFAGLYERIEQDVAQRARILTFRKNVKPGKKSEHRRSMLTNLAANKSSRPA